MKNVINLITRNLYMRIPKEILTVAFHDLQQETNRTIDSLIKEYIIIDVVLAHCNLYAGKTKKIVLYEQFGKRIDDTMMVASMSGSYGVYTIPPEAREYRPISVVLDVAYPTTTALFGTFPNVNNVGRSVANGIDEALSSFTHAPAYVTPQPQLIDGDSGIVQLSPPASIHVDWILSCMLAYDNEFSNISPNMLTSLKKMTEYATKAFIYNTLFIRINQGYLQGGVQLESIRSIVESYADSNTEFEAALLKFRGASVFTTEGLAEMCSLMIGS